jgi:DNA-binding transcriptional ArsR family regulator
MNASSKDPTPEQLLKALRHPMRRRILRTMGEETISPHELSKTLDAPLSNVSYHVRVLAECGAVVLTATKPVRGSMQHFYRLNVEVGWVRSALEAEDDSAQPSS